MTRETTRILLPHCGGYLSIEKNTDSMYPGISITFGTDNGDIEKDLVVIEAPTDENGKINIYNWGDPKNEDYTVKTTVSSKELIETIEYTD